MLLLSINALQEHLDWQTDWFDYEEQQPARQTARGRGRGACSSRAAQAEFSGYSQSAPQVQLVTFSSLLGII